MRKNDNLTCFSSFFTQTRSAGVSPDGQPAKTSSGKRKPKRGEPGYVAPKRNITPLVALAQHEKTLESFAAKYKRAVEFQDEREDIKKRLVTYGRANKKSALVEQAVKIAESLLEYEDSWADWDAYNYHDSKGIKYKDQDILSTLSELVHKVAESIDPQSQYNPNYWKDQHEDAMVTYEELKNEAEEYKNQKIRLM
tara:strand:+ start:258 stop:845 length:588 start_codon:yes stop_codon:yes gene_type:complete